MKNRDLIILLDANTLFDPVIICILLRYSKTRFNKIDEMSPSSGSSANFIPKT